MDNLDRKILSCLQKDSKQTIKELSEKVGLSPTPIHERIKKLEKNGTIESYVAIVNRKALDLELMAFCNVSLKEHNKEYVTKFEEEVLEFAEVAECFHTAGTFDYILKIFVEDMEAYQRFIVNKLAASAYIGKVDSSFVMTEVKSTTRLPLE